MTKSIKIKKLIVVLAVAFSWAHKTGEWRCNNERQIRLKTHGRKEKSIFRYGLDILQDTVSKLAENTDIMMKLVKILILPIGTMQPICSS